MLRTLHKANCLLVLDEDPKGAEALLSATLPQLPSYAHAPILEQLIPLIEADGRYEEARRLFRPLVVLPEGQSSSYAESPRYLMRYALLSRTTGNTQEEEATLARIKGDSFREKLMRAVDEARSNGAEGDILIFLTVLRRVSPETGEIDKEIAKTKRSIARRLEAARKSLRRSQTAP